MAVGNEHGFGSGPRERRMALVRDDADDLVPLRFRRRDPKQQALADRRLAVERERRELIVDDDPPRQIGFLIDDVVDWGERAAGEQARLQRLEISGSDTMKV